MNLVGITRLECVLIKILPRHEIEKVIAKVISIAKDKQHNSGEREVLQLTGKMDDQPTDYGDGNNRTERTNNDKAEQAAKVTRRWPAAGDLNSPAGATPVCHKGANQQRNDIKAEWQTVLPSGSLFAMPLVKNNGRNDARRA